MKKLIKIPILGRIDDPKTVQKLMRMLPPKKKKQRSISKLKKELEDLVKLWVKHRDNWTCQKCGKWVEGSDAHGSHVIPVSAGNQFRFDPMNIKLLCYHDHLNWFHKNPIEAANWFKEKFPDRYEYLFGQPRVATKVTRDGLLEQIEEWKEKLRQLQDS